MDADVNVAAVAALVADPTRAHMLTALMDGRARTAKELAYGAGVTPQTASSHLAKLLRARLLAMERQSRHRYFRLAGPSVGHAIEGLMAVAPARPRAVSRPPDALHELRLARTCYDNLAGRLGVRVTDAMVRRRLLAPSGRDFRVTAAGERRAHLAGSLGAALARRCLDLRWVRRVDEQRTLALTPHGRRALRTWFGIQWTG